MPWIFSRLKHGSTLAISAWLKSLDIDQKGPKSFLATHRQVQPSLNYSSIGIYHLTRQEDQKKFQSHSDPISSSSCVPWEILLQALARDRPEMYRHISTCNTTKLLNMRLLNPTVPFTISATVQCNHGTARRVQDLAAASCRMQVFPP